MLGRISSASLRGVVGARARPARATALRSFSAAKKNKKAAGEVQAPKQLYGVTGRYSMALYVAAAKAGTLDKVESDLSVSFFVPSLSLSTYLPTYLPTYLYIYNDKLTFSLSQNFVSHVESNPTFAAFLKNPTIPRTAKKADIEAICGKGKFSPTSVALFGTLAENGRLGDVAAVSEAYGDLMRAHRGEVAAVVTSADELTAKQRKQLEASFSSFVKSGETLKASYKVDSQLMGGLTVQIGDKFMDLSSATKINKMHKLLSESV